MRNDFSLIAMIVVLVLSLAFLAEQISTYR
jgi:hypothetical protein